MVAIVADDRRVLLDPASLRMVQALVPRSSRDNDEEDRLDSVDSALHYGVLAITLQGRDLRAELVQLVGELCCGATSLLPNWSPYRRSRLPGRDVRPPRTPLPWSSPPRFPVQGRLPDPRTRGSPSGCPASRPRVRPRAGCRPRGYRRAPRPTGSNKTTSRRDIAPGNSCRVRRAAGKPLHRRCPQCRGLLRPSSAV